MAQHDYSIANQSGAAFRSDLNNALSAIVSLNSGTAEPSTTYAYMLWADTTAGLLKMRNGANNAWITLRELDGTLTIEDGTAAAPGLSFASDLNTGIYRVGADQLGIATGGVGRLLVDASGRVGIGTTSPSELLHISSSTSDANLQIQSTFAGGDARINLYANSGGTSQIRFGDESSSNVGLLTYDHTDDSMAFRVNNNERARIDSSGRLLVGTSSTSAATTTLLQGNSSSSTGNAVLLLAVGTSTPTDGSSLGTLAFTDSGHDLAATIIGRRDGGTWTSGTSQPTRLVFSTTADGASSPTERIIINKAGTMYPATDNAFQAGSASFRWTAIYAVNGTIQTSDARQKTDVSSCSLGSTFIKSLRPVSYKWIEGGNTVTKSEDGKADVVTPVPGERTHWGFLAQDVKAAVDDAGVDFGGWILTDKDDPNSAQGLRYDQFIAPLTKALQETMAELEALKAEVAALKAQ